MAPFCPPNSFRHLPALLLFCLLPIFSSAQVIKTFRNGVRKFDHGDKAKAERIFTKKQHHRVWEPGATLYIERLHASQYHTLAQWAKADSLLCNAGDQVKAATGRSKKRLHKRGITSQKIESLRSGIEATALNYVKESMNILLMDSLIDCFPCWSTGLTAERDSAIVVIANDNVYKEDYDILESVLNRHEKAIRDPNYEEAWNKRDSIWLYFPTKHTLCEMDMFRKDFPDNPYSNDCWFYPVRDLMCSESLPEVLAFHTGNLYTALEYPVVDAILHRGTPAEIAALPAAERLHLEDMQLLYKLRLQLDGCAYFFDTLQLREKIDYYARKYTPRRTAFELVTDGTNYFLHYHNLYSANRLVNELAEVFPDSAICKETTLFEFQTGKQAWFARYKKYLGAMDEDLSNRPMDVWNTVENHEFSAVSYSNGSEVYFARTNPQRRQTNVLRSKLIEGKWTTPEIVPELSGSRRAVPLSMTADGRTMLLSMGKDLYLSYRRDTAMNWFTPSRIIVDKMPYIGRATILPDGRAIVFEGSTTKLSGRRRPVTDLFVMNRNKNGSYNSPQPLDAINTPFFSEGNPLICADGYTLIYTTNAPGGFGKKDVVSTNRKDKKKWNKWDDEENLGWRVNTMEDDYGFSFMPDYGGDGYYTRTMLCKGNRDIWKMDLPARSWPKGSPRFIGIVTDLKGKPQSGGYMEITLDNEKKPLWVPINGETGEFSFRVPDTTKVIRLFPDLPGHITVFDSVHDVTKIKQGAIVRDTFRLSSFEDIRTNFQLQYATFDDNQSLLNDPRVYAELTLLHHHATRMGARILFKGHTDNSGTEGKNQSLALDRAITLQKYMIEHTGFSPADIDVVSMGASQPKCDNNTDEGRRCNRRVEVVFITGGK